MSKNIAEPGKPQMTVWSMRQACSVPKDTNTYSEYVRVIAFLLQQWKHESVSMVLYTYIACHLATDPIKLDFSFK
jgi:hypothetical protein